jgi:hypothetical protein
MSIQLAELNEHELEVFFENLVQGAGGEPVSQTVPACQPGRQDLSRLSSSRIRNVHESCSAVSPREYVTNSMCILNSPGMAGSLI